MRYLERFLKLNANLSYILFLFCAEGYKLVLCTEGVALKCLGCICRGNTEVGKDRRNGAARAYRSATEEIDIYRRLVLEACEHRGLAVVAVEVNVEVSVRMHRYYKGFILIYKRAITRGERAAITHLLVGDNDHSEKEYEDKEHYGYKGDHKGYKLKDTLGHRAVMNSYGEQKRKGYLGEIKPKLRAKEKFLFHFL